jgi:uncharacterized membrane protein YfcA
MPFTSSPQSTASPEQPLSKLRGAGAAVDARAAGRVLLGVVLVTLAVLVVVFTVVGVHKNAQIDELRTQGVPVTYTVDSCLGLLGGSGSNGAGYACTGSYALGAHHYREPLPGNAHYEPGDPTLVSTAEIVRTDRTSARVYILPGVLFALLVVLLALIVVRSRWGARDRTQAGAT